MTTVFSDSHKDHLQHLKKVFLKCRRFGISINPKKSHFSLEEGKLLGHIVSAEGVKIDPNKGSSNSDIVHPKVKKGHSVFPSKTLRDAELSYDLIEKQAYALIKSLKTIYILHSKVTSYVLLASVKDVLTQPDIDGKRAKWIAKFIEFNIEVKPTKLVKGQGLAKLMAEENYSLLDINCVGSNSGAERTEEEAVEREHNQSLAENLATCEWYSSIVHFLQKIKVPPGLA
eukprot:PITA_32302